MNEPDLVTAIQRRARLRSEGEARKLLEGVLQALAHVLPKQQVDALCACIPADAVWCLRCGPATPDPLVDSEVFVGWVMSSIETTGGPDQTLGGDDPLAALTGVEAHARIEAVLDELWKHMDTALRGSVGACLPSGVADHLARGDATSQHQGEP